MKTTLRKRWVQAALAAVLVTAFFVFYRYVRVSPVHRPPPNVIADIDGNIVTALEFRAAVNRRILRIVNKYGVFRGSDKHPVKISVFHELMNDKILENIAGDEGVQVSEEDVTKRLVRLRTSIYNYIGMESPSYYNFFIQNLGFQTEEEFRRNIKNELLEVKLAQHFFPEVTVTDDEVVESIPTHRLRQIYFSVDTAAGTRDVDINQARKRIRERAREVYARAAGGEDFAALARRYSQEAFAAQGGDIGWVSKRMVTSRFWAVASKMEPGQISPPFETEYGVHILKLIDRKNPEDQVYEFQKKLIKTFVEIRKRQSSFTGWFFRYRSDLEEEDRIKIYDPFLLANRNELIGELGKALEYYRRAAREEPDDPYLLVKTGEILARQGKRKDALDEFRRATEISPMDSALYFRLGEVYMGYGEHQKGLLEFNRASDLAKLDYELHRRLEAIYTQLGLFREADRERERYLRAVELRGGRSFTLDVPLDVPRYKPEAPTERYAEPSIPWMYMEETPGTPPGTPAPAQ
ncbi:MAG: peptidylprolyl isomerase [bacterium]